MKIVSLSFFRENTAQVFEWAKITPVKVVDQNEVKMIISFPEIVNIDEV